MIEPPIPPDEEQRLALLKACKIMYTPVEQAFDDVARLAADLCGTEIALITLVDSDYQWFKARVGVEQTGTPRDLSFCGHCIAHHDALVVEDTLLDPRFADNPLVTGEPHLRFYAGVPLLVEQGSSVGALSVAAREPRTITPRQLDALRRLADQVARELRLRRDLEGRSRPPSALSLGIGTLVGGRWRIVRELGRGRFGAVFEARGAADERAAIKVLQPQWRANELVLERFAREARVLMRLTSPHVGKLLDVGNLDPALDELPYLVLEYLEGTDFEKLIKARGLLPFREAFRWCADACEGVAEAHDLGVIHRDLKPSNVFLASGEGEPVVKVIDFGIAGERPTSGSVRLTDVDALLGSPAYMSPEQMLGEDVDPRSDVWSMGALLYEAATGRIPFDGKTELQVFAAALSRPPLPPNALLAQALPEDAEKAILHCLRRERGERFASMRELAQALRLAAAA
jgi:serine/threonine-protein kinase